MATKLKGSVLRDLCAAWGYTGADSFTDRKAWAATQNGTVKDGNTDVAVRDIEWEDDTPATKSFTVSRNSDEDIKDIQAKAKAQASAELTASLKAMGYDLPGLARPGAITPGEVRVGKSWEERCFDDRQKSGKTFFSAFDVTKAAGHYLRSMVLASKGNFQDAQTERKSFMEMQDAIGGKAYATTAASNGQTYVPIIFERDLIKNVNNHGAFSQLTKVYNTNAQQITVPVNSGGVTVAFTGENVAITASQSTLSSVQLTAQPLKGLVQISNEMIADSAINIVDDAFDDLAREIAKMQDQCLLIGDGTATYGGMTGADHQFGTACATSNGRKIAGGASQLQHTAANLASLIAICPTYALPNAKFTCSQAAFGRIFTQLNTSTLIGGMTQEMLANGGMRYRYHGFPIVINNVMNAVDDIGSSTYAGFTSGDIPDVLFGDFSRASKMLQTQSIELAADSSYGFATNSTYLRAVARFHTVVHDYGNDTSSGTAGPIVALWQT